MVRKWMKGMSINDGKMDNSRAQHLPQTELVACPHAIQYLCKSNLPIERYAQIKFCTFEHEKNVLQLNFQSQYFKKYKLVWAEIFQAGKYHYSASPCKNLDKPTSRILRKMQIGCR